MITSESVVVFVLVVLGIFVGSLWFSECYVERKKRKRRALEDRIIKLSPKYRKAHNLSDKYAKILTISKDLKDYEIEILPSPQIINKEKALYDKRFAKEMKAYTMRKKRYDDGIQLANK